MQPENHNPTPGDQTPTHCDAQLPAGAQDRCSHHAEFSRNLRDALLNSINLAEVNPEMHELDLVGTAQELVRTVQNELLYIVNSSDETSLNGLDEEDERVANTVEILEIRLGRPSFDPNDSPVPIAGALLRPLNSYGKAVVVEQTPRGIYSFANNVGESAVRILLNSITPPPKVCGDYKVESVYSGRAFQNAIFSTIKLNRDFPEGDTHIGFLMKEALRMHCRDFDSQCIATCNNINFTDNASKAHVIYVADDGTVRFVITRSPHGVISVTLKDGKA